MKKSLLLASFSFISSICFSGTVFSQTIPNMMGTWKGMTNSTVMGVGAHHEVPNKKDKEIYVNRIPLTIVIDHQDGVNFWGSTISSKHKEQIIASLTPDFKEGIMVDSDGIRTFKIVNPTTIHTCYAQLEKPKVAGCFEMKKQ
jgi:hypothetical protein